jgi:hypothetical protein
MAAVDFFDTRYPNKLIYADRKWEVAFLGGSPVFRKDSYLDFDAMINFFAKAYSTSDGMVFAMPGKGSQYLVALRDADGDLLTGGASYRLRVPANVPTANYWSVVIYDADTRSLLDNGQPFPSVASNTNLKPNADGSADLYFGPTAPKGRQRQLDQDRPRTRMVRRHASLCPHAGVLRQDVEARRHREGEVSRERAHKGRNHEGADHGFPGTEH